MLTSLPSETFVFLWISHTYQFASVSGVSAMIIIGWRPSVANWGCDMSAACTAGSVICWHGQWVAT